MEHNCSEGSEYVKVSQEARREVDEAIIKSRPKAPAKERPLPPEYTRAVNGWTGTPGACASLR